MASYDECAGCLEKLNNIPSLHCSRCPAIYHHLCMNLSQKEYDALTNAFKADWVCVLCRSKERKGGDNSNTPIRAEPSPQPPEFVTQRSKQRSTASCLCLTASSIRDIIREELQNSFKLQFIPQLQEVRGAVCGLETSLSYFNEELEKVRAEQAAQSLALESIRKENEVLRACNTSLTSRVAQLDQLSRSSNIEIQCVPEHKQENLVNTVQQLGKLIKCPVNENNIHYCARLAKMNSDSPRPRSVLVKFSSPRLRDEFMAATSKFNRNNQNDKLNSSHLGIAVAKRTPIYIVEHLTSENKALHAAARSKAKELKYRFVWVRDGRIYMRKSEEASYVHVRSIDTLNNLS